MHELESLGLDDIARVVGGLLEDVDPQTYRAKIGSRKRCNRLPIALEDIEKIAREHPTPAVRAEVLRLRAEVASCNDQGM